MRLERVYGESSSGSDAQRAANRKARRAPSARDRETARSIVEASEPWLVGREGKAARQTWAKQEKQMGGRLNQLNRRLGKVFDYADRKELLLPGMAEDKIRRADPELSARRDWVEHEQRL